MPRERPDAQAMLDQLLGGLGVAKPEYLSGFNPSFLGDVNNLYQNLAGQYSGLDLENAGVRTGYERGVGDIAGNRARAITALENKLANRGMLQSSAALNQRGNLDREFDTQLSDLGSTRDAALQSIIARRLGFENDYDTNLTSLKGGLVGQGTEYARNKADEEARRINAEQVAQGGGQLASQQSGIMNQQIGAIAPPPPIDLSAILAAFRPVAPPPPAPVKPQAPYVDPRVRDPLGQQASAAYKPVVPAKPTLQGAKKTLTAPPKAGAIKSRYR